MNVVKYFRIKNKMTQRYEGEEGDGCNIACYTCGLHSSNNGTGTICTDFEHKYPEKAAKIVSEWDKNHSEKTRLSEMLEILPYVDDEDIITSISPCTLGGTYELIYCDRYSTCESCRNAFWSAKIKTEE